MSNGDEYTVIMLETDDGSTVSFEIGESEEDAGMVEVRAMLNGDGDSVALVVTPECVRQIAEAFLDWLDGYEKGGEGEEWKRGGE